MLCINCLPLTTDLFTLMKRIRLVFPKWRRYGNSRHWLFPVLIDCQENQSRGKASHKETKFFWSQRI